MPKAIRVCEENLEFIIEYAKDRRLNLDYLKDTLEYNAENGFDTMLVTDGTPEQNNVTFTEMIEDDFNNSWKFAQAENPNHFVEIVRR